LQGAQLTRIAIFGPVGIRQKLNNAFGKGLGRLGVGKLSGLSTLYVLAAR